MFTVFGRSFSSHILQAAIVEWENSHEVDKLALACNLRRDHRISSAREDAFLDLYFKAPPTGEELRDALDKHRKEVIGPAELPEFLDEKINKNNLIVGHHSAQNFINRDVKLVNVLDLNGLLKVFQWYKFTKGKRHSEIDYLAVLKQSNFDRWLEQLLDKQSVSNRENFVLLALEVLNSHCNARGPYQPIWATTWDAFEGYVDIGADRWAQVVGVAKWEPHWLIVLKYSVAEVGTLCRPTQIDGGFYAYHFASPPQTPLSQGGHPMNLKATTPTLNLLPEYIHKQISYKPEHWIDADRLIDRTSSSPENLRRLRQSHYDLCQQTYGSCIRRWMPSAI